MELNLSLSPQEKEKLRNLKMLQSIRNSLVQQFKRLDLEIERHNNDIVTKINQKYNVEMKHDYTYDEVNERLLHCLGNAKLIEGSSTKIKVGDLLDRVVEDNFGDMLRSISSEYRQIEQVRRKEGVRNV